MIRLAGQGVQPVGGVAGPVGGAQPGELVDRLVEDVEAVGAGGGGGYLAGAGEPQVRAGHEASWSRRASSEVRTKLFIGGGWVDGLDGADIEVRDLHDGSPLAEMAEARAPDVDRAVQAARAAFERSSRTACGKAALGPVRPGQPGSPAVPEWSRSLPA